MTNVFEIKRGCEGINAGFICFYYVDRNSKKIGIGYIVRKDGSIGFAGGKFEKGESLSQAIYREVKEEINFDISDFMDSDGAVDELKAICSHLFIDAKGRPFMTHLAVYEVTKEDLIDIKNNAMTGTHSTDELRGFEIYEFSLDDDIKSQKRKLLEMEMATTVKEEIGQLPAHFGAGL